MYKKHGRHDIGAESTNNDEEQFVIQFFNFMRKHPYIIISQLSIPQINLDTGTRFTLRSVSSSLDHQKYPMDDINEPTLCILLYVKGRTLRTIKVADAILMVTRIMHGRPIPSECVVVEVTTIREGHEFEDLDYPDEEEGIEELKDAKENFILWPRKDIILKTRSSPIVLPRNGEDEGTLTSQNTIHSTARFTPPSQNHLKTTHLPENSPPTQPLKHHSPQRVAVSKSPPHTM
jgi:hypothetical protein